MANAVCASPHHRFTRLIGANTGYKVPRGGISRFPHKGFSLDKCHLPQLKLASSHIKENTCSAGLVCV